MQKPARFHAATGGQLALGPTVSSRPRRTVHLFKENPSPVSPGIGSRPAHRSKVPMSTETHSRDSACRASGCNGSGDVTMDGPGRPPVEGVGCGVISRHGASGPNELPGAEPWQ